LRGTGRRQVKKGDHDHCADSFRYGYQRVYTHDTHAFEEIDNVIPNSPEWLTLKAAALKAEALKKPVRGPSWLGLDSQFVR